MYRLTDEFYVEESTNYKTYTSRAKGPISVGRLVRGESDYFERPDSLKIKKPKTLVLTDWTLDSLSQAELNQRKEVLRALLSETPPFTLYYYSNNKLTELKKEKIDSLFDESNIMGIEETLLDKKMGELGISKDSYLELNFQRMNALCGKVEEGTVIETNYHSMDACNECVKALKLLEEKKAPFSIKLHSTTEEEVSSYLSLIKRFPNIKHSAEPDELIVEGKTLEFIWFINAVEQSRATNIKGIMIQHEAICHATKLTLQDNQSGMPFTYLDKILRGPVRLKSLTFNKFKTERQPSDKLDEIELEDLEELSISESAIETWEICRLLYHAKSLKRMSLYKNIYIPDLSVFDEMTFPVIEELMISECTFTLGSLNKMIGDGRSLHKLDLSYTSFLDFSEETEASEVFDIRQFDFNSLRDLDLSGTVLTQIEGIAEVLRNNIKLQTLSLNGCFVDAGSESTSSLNLPELTTLELHEADLTLSVFNRLVKQAPKLSTLDVRRATFIDELDEETILPFETLTELKLSGHEIALEKILMLIKQCPNLESLSLEEVSLSTNDLATLKNACPHLNTLCMENSQITTSPGEENFELAHLIFLQLDQVTLDDNIIKKMLRTNEALEHLSLIDCQFSDSGCELDEINASSLNVLDARGSRLKGESLVDFFQHTPNLIQLILSETDIPEHIEQATLDQIRIDSLSRLQLQNVKLPYQLLHQLVKDKRDLVQLSVDNLELYPSSLKDRETFPNNTIQKIEYVRSKLPMDFLKDILASSSELNTAKLFSNTFQGVLEELNEEACSRLQTLDLRQSDVDTKSLKTILQTCDPELLCSVALDGCRGIDKEELGDLLPPERKAKQEEMDEREQKRIRSVNAAKAKAKAEAEKRKMDASHDGDISKLDAKRYFYSVDGKENPPPNNYRLSMYETLEFNPLPCEQTEAFTIYTIDPEKSTFEKQTIPYLDEDLFKKAQLMQAELSEHERVFFGRDSNMTLDTTWTAIPSLYPDEKMLGYHLNPKDKVEIQYCKERNQYFIRSLTGSSIKTDLSWIIKQDTTPSKTTLPSSLNDLQRHYQAFKAEILDTSELLTGAGYMQAIGDQKKGSCRHRALHFTHTMKERHPDYTTRIISNGCHMYVEVLVDNQWRQLDLGGAPANLIIDEQNDPLGAEGETQIKMSLPGDLRVHTVEEQSVITAKKEVKAYFDTLYQRNKGIQSNVSDCVDSLIKTDIPSVFVHLDEEVSYPLEQHIINHAATLKRPLYLINSPEDLVCSSNYVSSEDGLNGIIKRGPGGPLFDFLKAHEGSSPPPLLVINYNTFSASDIVRFNQILDSTPSVDGVPLPKGTSVLGLMDRNKPNAYTGSDFYSRFTEHTRFEFTKEQLEHPHSFIEGNMAEMQDAYTINLYHGSDWREQLLGRWIIEGQRLSFKEGELSKAIRSGKSINIQNGLWNDPNFTLFWHQLSINQKLNDIPIPKTIKFYRTKGYQFKDYLDKCTFTPFQGTILAGNECLNPSELPSFISQFECEPSTEGLFTVPGKLQQYQDTTCTVIITRALSEREWARLFDSAQEYRVTLDIQVCPGVKLPPSFDVPMPEAEREAVPIIEDAEVPPETAVIESTSVDFTVALLKTKVDNPFVIDITDLSITDLISNLKGHIDTSTCEFRFSEKPGVLSTLADKTVILKGEVTPEMMDGLMPFLLKKPPGVILVTSPTPINNTFKQFCHTVTNEFKQSCFIDKTSQQLIDKISEKEWTDNTFSQLSTKLMALGKEASAPTDAAWIGIDSLPPINKLQDFDIKTVDEVCLAFIQSRLLSVSDKLDTGPTAILTGATGVGKSTFIEQHLKDHTNTLYKGENKLLSWVQDKTLDKEKILFIDEANITMDNWMKFEGLYEIPPYIIIDSEKYDLTDKHKIIFAINPASYGDERQTPEFFKQHGQACLFTPMPLAYIYKNILDPLFENTSLKARKEEVAGKLLKLYQFMADMSDTKILISPRELKMITMLTIAEMDASPTQDPIDILHHFIHVICKDNIPKEKWEIFENQFKQNTAYFKTDGRSLREDSSFITTPSRETIIHNLSSFLKLRHYRQNHKGLNAFQSHGGLGALVIEGEPGIGKSVLMTKILEEFGIQKDDPHNGFVQVPVSINIDEKKLQLLEAFFNGSVVIMDEINASPSMERFLNALLMGKLPDEFASDDRFATRTPKPGFFVIGTQNPISMAGRKAVSHALARRTFQTSLPSYTQAEMMVILVQSKGIDPIVAEALINTYVETKENAKKSNLQPIPCFRDLLNIAAPYFKTTSKTKLHQVQARSDTTREAYFAGGEHTFFPKPVDQPVRPHHSSQLTVNSGETSEAAQIIIQEQKHVLSQLQAEKQLIIDTVHDITERKMELEMKRTGLAHHIITLTEQLTQSVSQTSTSDRLEVKIQSIQSEIEELDKIDDQLDEVHATCMKDGPPIDILISETTALIDDLTQQVVSYQGSQVNNK